MFHGHSLVALFAFQPHERAAAIYNVLPVVVWY